MQYWHEWQGCELVYLPLHELASVEWDSINDYLAYQFPVLNNPAFEKVLGTLKEPAHMLINKVLVQTNLQETDGKAFLLFTNDILQKNTNQYEILAKYLPEQNTVEKFFLEGFTRLSQIRRNGTSNKVGASFSPSQFHSITENISTFLPDTGIDTEEEEDERIPIISNEVKSRIDTILKIGDKSAIIEIMVHLLNNLNPYLKVNQASVLKMLEKHWSEYAVAKQSSRIFIDKHSRIFLTDFGNIEIKMTPLPKTLFVFYLQRPDGVAFKYLSDHRQELERIYSKVSNSSRPTEIRERINYLVDASNNSMHEKCTRVKEAFVKKMDIALVEPYIIAGPRGGIKKINLDQSLITWAPSTLQACRE